MFQYSELNVLIFLANQILYKLSNWWSGFHEKYILSIFFVEWIVWLL